MHNSALRRFRYKLVPAFSYLPEFILKWFMKHWKLDNDPTDLWNYWLDCSYYKWCRKDKKKNGCND